ncbi:von Willebrand factor type A domain protein [Planctomycetes bacterium MalM25]|nr:von Willebrand factor type A domain protein [Planctomycetes bacterium MalM25]
MCKPIRRRRLIRNGPSRRGATLVLIAVMSSALVGMGALVINWSFIELTNTQLRSATDAAAKAAAVALSQTQNKSDARAAAKQLVKNYYIGGQKLKITNADIEFGNGTQDGQGGYTFTPDVSPLNCARVTARCGEGAATSSVPVFFSNLMPEGTFDLQKEATAGRYDHDVCVVVDRSGSMAWDLSGEDFSYPAEYNNDSTLQNYFRAPHPTESRWAKLVEALESFKDVIDSRNLNAQVGLASYSSDYTFGLFESSKVTQDQVMSPDTGDFLDAAYAIGQEPIIGDTDIKAGIDNGRLILTSSSERRMTATRTMVLLSDGRKTSGGNPLTGASKAFDKRITVHTVSFGDGADQQALTDIAEATGGRHYHALTGDQLADAFKDIAEQLPAILME